jgi:hypothetical protein
MARIQIEQQRKRMFGVLAYCSHTCIGLTHLYHIVELQMEMNQLALSLQDERESKMELLERADKLQHGTDRSKRERYCYQLTESNALLPLL